MICNGVFVLQYCVPL